MTQGVREGVPENVDAQSLLPKTSDLGMDRHTNLAMEKVRTIRSRGQGGASDIGTVCWCQQGC